MPTVTTTNQGMHQGSWTAASTKMLQCSVDQNTLTSNDQNLTVVSLEPLQPCLRLAVFTRCWLVGDPEHALSHVLNRWRRVWPAFWKNWNVEQMKYIMFCVVWSPLEPTGNEDALKRQNSKVWWKSSKLHTCSVRKLKKMSKTATP